VSPCGGILSARVLAGSDSRGPSVCLESGKKVLAAIYYRKALELDPESATALEKLREIEGERKRPDP
jgi:hypothetical protein